RRSRRPDWDTRRGSLRSPFCVWRWWSRTVWRPSGEPILWRRAGRRRSISAQRSSASAGSNGSPVHSASNCDNTSARSPLRAIADSDFWNFGREKSRWRPRRASRPTWTLKSSEAKRIPLPLPRCDVLATMSERRFLSPARRRRREGLPTLGLLARKARDGSRRLGHGVSEGTDQDELSVFEQIHDLFVGPRPQNCRSDDDQTNP